MVWCTAIHPSGSRHRILAASLLILPLAHPTSPHTHTLTDTDRYQYTTTSPDRRVSAGGTSTGERERTREQEMAALTLFKDVGTTARYTRGG